MAAAKKTRRRSDRCQPIREHIKQVQQDILDIREALTDPDILQSIKDSLKKELPRLQRLLSQLKAALATCERLGDIRRHLRHR